MFYYHILSDKKQENRFIKKSKITNNTSKVYASIWKDFLMKRTWDQTNIKHITIRMLCETEMRANELNYIYQ